jgi:DNA invertase Pin-like site-specific DNA recombinase
MAEGERQRIVKRANDGRVAARKRGIHMGRKPKLSELQRRVARESVAKGESACTAGEAQQRSVLHSTSTWREHPRHRQGFAVHHATIARLR